ncbi:hypothetical protein E4U42_000344 [Claviceps africana]|uniref:Uncharacterized protein n=1 Tax=Claviceps africana TaxID=83212 RepID=A0A8K0J0P8_9HYPO|nr:hypothetical protein E4U42_000344 [Claviceps africana]
MAHHVSHYLPRLARSLLYYGADAVMTYMQFPSLGCCVVPVLSGRLHAGSVTAAAGGDMSDRLHADSCTESAGRSCRSVLHRHAPQWLRREGASRGRRRRASKMLNEAGPHRQQHPRRRDWERLSGIAGHDLEYE